MGDQPTVLAQAVTMVTDTIGDVVTLVKTDAMLLIGVGAYLVGKGIGFFKSLTGQGKRGRK